MSLLQPCVALALYVKNEFSDISGWIAWHAAWGVTTFFIYDDHSTDGTYEILQAASKCYDIRLFRTDIDTYPDFYIRQREAFLDAAAQARGHYDWIGFLDGDEYLYLRHYDTLQPYLAHFEHADGIAFSWRIHGSSGRVVRPHETAISAFPRHSTPALNDNVLVKSFVRPDKMGSEYINPHWFDVPTERYVRPNGVPVESANAVQNIDWSDGFIMHYICRSMEHYIQRIKRRLNVDLVDSDGYMKHFDRNDLIDEEPLKFIPRTEEFLLPIYEESLNLAISKLSLLTINNIVLPFQSDTKTNVPDDFLENSCIYRLESYFRTRLYYDPSQMRLLHTTSDSAEHHGFLEVKAIRHSCSLDLMTLFVPGYNGALKIFMDNRLMRSLIYRCLPEADGRVLLRNPVSNLYLSCGNPDSGSDTVEANRRAGDDWERFSLTLLEENRTISSSNISVSFADRDFSAARIIQWLSNLTIAPNHETFLRVLYQSTPATREEISRLVPGLLWNVL